MVETQLCKLRGTSDIYTNYRSPVSVVVNPWYVPAYTRYQYVPGTVSVSYTHLRAHETRGNLVCRLLLEKKRSQIASADDYSTRIQLQPVGSNKSQLVGWLAQPTTIRPSQLLLKTSREVSQLKALMTDNRSCSRERPCAVTLYIATARGGFVPKQASCAPVTPQAGII